MTWMSGSCRGAHILYYAVTYYFLDSVLRIFVVCKNAQAANFYLYDQGSELEYVRMLERVFRL